MNPNLKAELVARSQTAHAMLTQANCPAMLVGIDQDSFWFQLFEGTVVKDLSSNIVTLYERWPDVHSVYLNITPTGRFLVCQFFGEQQEDHAHCEEEV